MTILKIKKNLQEKRKKELAREYETSIQNINAWSRNRYSIYNKDMITKVDFAKKTLVINKQKDKKYIEKQKKNFCIVLKCYDYYYSNCDIEEYNCFSNKLRLFIDLLKDDNDNNYLYEYDIYSF